MIPDEDLPPLGLWFRRQRRDHGYAKSASALLRDVNAQLPVGSKKIHLPEYYPLEGHGDISTARPRWIAEQVAKFYGEELPTFADQGMDALIDALSGHTQAMAEQTKAIQALVGLIERQQGDLVTMAEHQSLALGVLTRVLAPRGTDIGAALQGAASDLAALRRLSSGPGQ